MSGKDDADGSRRHQAPYSARNPIPTISKYRREKAEREKDAGLDYSAAEDDTSNAAAQQPKADNTQPTTDDSGQGAGQDTQGEDDGAPKDTSQIHPGASDPKQRRKEMKGGGSGSAQREVTDPVTHLPVAIHDFTDKSLEDLEPNDPAFGTTKKTATGIEGKNKSEEQLQTEYDQAQEEHSILVNRFPPPDFDALRTDVASIGQRAVLFGLGGSVAIIISSLTLERLVSSGKLHDFGRDHSYLGGALSLVLVSIGIAAVAVVIIGTRDWATKKINNAFQDEVWDAQRKQIQEDAKQHDTETTVWLNSLVGSVWPLINPDLFAGLADTLEDVMQASLPKFIRMVSVDDIGQGSEALRILGIRWLPTGAASRAVTEDGGLSKDDEANNSSNDDMPGQDEPDKTKEHKDSEGKTIATGMEAEEGDFVNLEVAFAYRTRSSSKTLKQRTKDMHLYLAFYLPGNIKVPVWVDLQGIVGTMRMRLQLTPDPPFFALCTLTFLGQPKVDVSCVPLNKRGLNIMDVPFISNFVQSAVDAAMAEYVAPKSLTLDLKDMLAGDDFKKDTIATGVIMINIKRGYDFKVGDAGIPLIKDGSSDPYVSVGWAKFGKVLWSTRILMSEMEPYWDETCFLLVTPEELNVEERLRVQLWDSDRMTADDDLGRIEVDLKQIMRDERSNGSMWQRSDSFRALKTGDNMPGKLEWSVGYFSKTRIQKCQFEQQTYDPKVRTMEDLKKKVDDNCERKLRETMFKEGQTERDESELEQQKTQELKTEQDAMTISAPPPEGYPSGLFSLQIHNITGLELQQLSKSQSDDDNGTEEEEEGAGLPSAYCTIIMNHRKTFKTRTKPQNAKPFYNAGCERFVRDWRDCEVYVSVRDARLHEDDPLLGIVHLPLGEILKDKAQVMGYWPLAGGVGHGRIRLSMVWRSVQLQAPSNLIGWDYGTVEVQPVVSSPDCPDSLQSAKLKVKTNLSVGKMYGQSGQKEWHAKKDQSLSLAVQNRYSSCLSIAFKQKSVMGNDISAFCVLWLKDIPDEEEQQLELPIWKGDFKRATACCLEECGEKLGTLKANMTFWAGMGAAHSKWASSTQNLREVVEVIDTARDNADEDDMQKKAGIVDEEVSSDSDSSSDDEDIPDGSQDNKQGPIDQVRDYKKRDKALHRQHRGMMQWKIPRTAKWMKHKFDKVGDNVSEIFDHREKGGPSIETEV